VAEADLGAAGWGGEVRDFRPRERLVLRDARKSALLRMRLTGLGDLAQA